jgi:dodecin
MPCRSCCNRRSLYPVGDGHAYGAIDCRSMALDTGPDQREDGMPNHVYRLSEIVGSSESGVDDAIRTAIAKASQTVRNIEWFETQSIRGDVVEGQVAHYQVTLKIGFRVDD